MNRQKLYNFFEDDQKFYNKELSKSQIFLVLLISFFVIFNINKFNKIKSLEMEVCQRKNQLNSCDKQVNYNLGNISSKISKILYSINDVNQIEINNNKIKIKGQTNDSSNIQKYVNTISRLESKFQTNIDLINKKDNNYEFQISTLLGDDNEN